MLENNYLSVMIPKSVRGHLITCTFIVLGLGLVLLIWMNNDEAAPVLALIGISGSFGGLINNYKRSSLIPSDDENTKIVELSMFRIYMSPIIGGCLAVALYMVFLSGLISGELFPQFSEHSELLESPKQFMRSMLPATNGDLAKAVFWSFVAGFSERFVPALLSGAVNRSGNGGGPV